MIKITHLIFTYFLIGSSVLQAQASIRLGNSENLDLYLHTTDVGPSFAELYGHVQIRLVDQMRGGDYMMSWGLFNYAAPNFGLNFYKGRLLYKVGLFDRRRADYTYKYDERTVWQDKINFSALQRKRLLAKMYDSLKPENVSYLYNYFWDNCSTRPRDFIDYALNGEFKKRFVNKLSGRTWRDTVRLHQSIVPFSALALELLMNSNLDREMTVWEEMFLPHVLRASLQQLPRFDDDFKPVPNSQLLEDSSTYYDGLKYEFWPNRDYCIFYGLVILFAFMVFGLRKRYPRLSNRLIGFCLILWYLLGTAFGLLMPISWLTSNHLDLHHNVNMLLFWPTDFIFLIFGGLLVMNRPLPSGLIGRGFRYYIYGHLFAVALMVVLNFGLVKQNLTVVLLTYGVVCTMFWWVLIGRMAGGVGAHDSRS